MPNLLELEAERLKRKYGVRYHPLIDLNPKSVSEQMKAAPSSISIHEGRIALSAGLPTLSSRSILKRKRNRKGHEGKRSPKKMRHGYARVSTDDQNPALQPAALKRAGCEEVFRDDGLSGASATALPSCVASKTFNAAIRSLSGNSTG
jgi:Resolvase, N terminal domain